MIFLAFEFPFFTSSKFERIPRISLLGCDCFFETNHLVHRSVRKSVFGSLGFVTGSGLKALVGKKKKKKKKKKKGGGGGRGFEISRRTMLE
jgi:hypothetical protein